MTGQEERLNFVLKGKIAEADYVRFNLSHLGRRYRRPWFLIVIALAFVAFASVAWLELPQVLAGTKHFLSSFTYYTLIYFILAPALILFVAVRSSKRNFRTNRYFQEELTISISDQEILEQSASTSAVIRPDNVFQIIDDKKRAVYVYIAKNQAVILPNRYFADAAQRQAVVDHLRSHFVKAVGRK
jgi:hypothetical protein